MRYTLRQITVFVTLSRTQHFGRAADLLGISQPTVSSDIRALERSLGVRLFHRSRAGTTLSDQGEALLPSAERLLESAETFNTEAQRIRRSEAITVRLVVTPSMLNRLVPSTLSLLAEPKAHPITVEVIEAPTGGVSPVLARGDADLGAGHFIGQPHGTIRRTIGEDELWVLASPAVLGHAQSVVLSDLSHLELLNWPRTRNPEYYDHVLSVCAERGVTPTVVESAGLIVGAQSYMLTSGRAFSVVPADVAREAPTSLASAPIAPPATLGLQVAWRNPPIPGVDTVVRALRRAHGGDAARTFSDR